MFQGLTKKSYWEEIGGVVGFHNAVEQLGSKWLLLDEERQGFTRETTIWGTLAQLTTLKNKTSCKARKWLYSMWQEDRNGVKTKFYATKQVSDMPISPNDILDQRDDASQPVAKKVREFFIQCSTIHIRYEKPGSIESVC